MTRAYALLASLLLIATPLAGCTSSPEIEEIVDDILGCMDENAENYAENATAELLGDCIYLASMEVFMNAMTEQMEIDEMLEIMPRAGFSFTVMSSEFNADMGMQMDTIIEEMVMVDLDTDSAYIKMGISMAPFMTSEYTQVQVGELVNAHYTVGGMMAAENAGMGSYQTRDADPNIMEDYDLTNGESIISSFGDLLEIPSCDVSDMSSDMPADAEPVIVYEGMTGVQTMTLEYTNDTGHDISIVTLIDDREDLMSYVMSTDNGSASSSCSYTVMWGDAVVIEVDDTLPRTSIPIVFHVEGMPEDDGGDDIFYCDNGNEISRELVDDGWDDCGDGSDESDDGGDEVVFVCDDGQEIPFDWVNDGYPDCYDESDEATYEEGEGGEPNFVSYLDCWQFMNTSMVQNDAADEWDGTNLDMSDCGGESTEYYDDYVIGDTPVTAPYSISTIISEEGWSEMTGDDTGDYCEYEGGSYDADNDVCTLIIEMTRNETHLLDPIHNWMEESGASDEDEASMYCTDWTEGSYDADEDICTTIWAVIMDADGGALLLDDGDWVLDFYFYDASTGSGFRVNAEYGLQCDNGQIVHEWAYDDGWEDCEDGSDEPGQGEETSEFVCMDGTVIPFSWVNDWEEDCPDGSDEQWYYQDDGGDDDNGPPTPEEAMEDVDTDGDDYMSYQEFQDAWDSDPENPELDYDEVTILFDDCDYDGNDLIDIDEMQCFIDGIGAMLGGDGDDPSADEVFEWMNTDGDGQVTPSEWADFANSTGDIMDEDNFNGLVYTMDMYDYDDSDGLDIYEFTEMWDEIMSDEDDDGDGEGGNDEPFRVTMMVRDQTLNAPISDFEVRFLFDCGEPDEEGNEPPSSDCSIAASNGLTEGSATVDPTLTEYEFTYEYLDYDGDGLISDMDTLVIDNLWPDVRVELYDTWADQYTSESFATADVLPGFGAVMALTVLLGAAFATRRD
uniref:Low-density lipoprotein receptors containing Ca2+-binding EGF-like domains n=1 Tax=uncultured marine group II/III euryarchaeote KM3_82_C12 TaxID=1456518 RepID=A0A075HV36_9EURY|nr:Low-density lipoprotein receptors containing Ca2+-binding EGF-like domains [uncultured marine group II/III euryarchaeote KM3_82_C12]